jgi:diguanylate cyclase (GGDEF)-like protein
MHFREAIDLGNALLDAATTLHQAQYDVNHDALTGLPNRALFQMFVSHQLALCLRNKTSLSILYIDLDGFKLVNDSYGHAVGDQLLHAVSSRIEDAIRESDIAARLGGDEFAIALIDASLENATAFAGRLVGTVSDPYQLGEIRVSVSASIGVAAYPASAKDVDTLLRSADFAMYKAKSLGKRQVCAATP